MKPASRKLDKDTGNGEFQYIYRNSPKNIVLIPGWATDLKIFDWLDLGYNYILPRQFSPLTFKQSLLHYLGRNNLTKISVLGWSMGGFLAAEVAKQNKGLVDELILIGVRKKYGLESIAGIKKLLLRSKEGYLYKFYSRCFYSPKQALYFKKILFKYYCEKFDLNFLMKGLDYLGAAQIEPSGLEGIKKVRIVHGQNDNIAPLSEAESLCRSLPGADFIRIKDAGHLPFFDKNFGKYLW